MFGLMLLVRDARTLIKTITGFTAAHSITLAAASLGYIHVPPAPVEAVIALTEWQDPEFHADAAAVYYARVLEIPTPRWTPYIAVQNKLPLPTSVPSEIQERAWTSPIFYRLE